MDFDFYLDDFKGEEDINFLGVDLLIPQNDQKLDDYKQNEVYKDEDFGIIEPKNKQMNMNDLAASPPNSSAIAPPQAKSKPVEINGRHANAKSTLDACSFSVGSNGSYSSFGAGSFESPLLVYYKNKDKSKKGKAKRDKKGKKSSSYQHKSEKQPPVVFQKFEIPDFAKGRRLDQLSFFSSSWGVDDNYNHKQQQESVPHKKKEEKEQSGTKGNELIDSKSSCFGGKQNKTTNVKNSSKKKEQNENNKSSCSWPYIKTKTVCSKTVESQAKSKKKKKSTSAVSTSTAESSSKEHEDHSKTEKPSHTLFIRNLSSYMQDKDIKKIFEPYGEIKGLYSNCKHRGFVMLTYYDIRNAKRAKKELVNYLVHKRKIDVHFSLPKSNKSGENEGVVKIYCGWERRRIEKVANKYGEFSKEGVVFCDDSSSDSGKYVLVKFYDLRNSEKFQRDLNGKEEKLGKIIRVEFASLSFYRSKRRDNSKKSEKENSYTKSKAESSSNYYNNKYNNNGRYSTSRYGGINSKKGNLSSYYSRRKIRSNNSNLRNGKQSSSSFAVNLDNVLNGKDKRTTLMIRNIPNKYNRKMIISLIDRKFADKYNFLYLPIDFQNKCNMGYAFINLVDSKSIYNFVKEFRGNKWEKFNSEKICQLTYARIQGKEKLAEHFKNSSVNYMEKSLKPIFY